MVDKILEIFIFFLLSESSESSSNKISSSTGNNFSVNVFISPADLFNWASSVTFAKPTSDLVIVTIPVWPFTLFTSDAEIST